MKNWIEYYKKIGIPDTQIRVYENYIQKLHNNNLAIIFEVNHLAMLLGVRLNYLIKMQNSSNKFYREFEIPKRRGGVRKILAPYPTLLIIQKWIVQNILNNVKPHKCAHAYTANRSIISNTKLHLKQDEMLKLDLKDFFPSIHKHRVVHLFKHLGYSEGVAFLLANLCTFNNELPQGAPTSPSISNLIAKRLDNRLFLLSKKNKLRYSRYADDLIFSGKEIPQNFKSIAIQIIREEGFLENSDKTRLYKKKNKKIVTGIVVGEGTMKIPRDYRRDLVQTMSYVERYGLKSHMTKLKIKKINYLQSLIGKVNFWLQVEPDNLTAVRYKEILISELKGRLVD